ncbi:hypothetical protein K438DRAFT_2022634 [Mycena galopus ATCC 62051]|nr:hypothetical protein K438DRAFT_2022634 [Mycena galopus ATCC 62051]
MSDEFFADVSRTPAETTPASNPPSENDRLISTLQTCFQELITKQEEQSEQIHKAIEALKPPAAIQDTKTAFWNSYMKLADEYDRELQQKYSTDLNTGLIFAGLFSAVSSAFIIQIQPELQSTLNPPGTKIIVAQSLLYISLFATLLASLLAVLGMQWLMYYQSAGSRGTVEDRGLERQRKLDGLRKWKFDTVLQTFPLLLQLALLLFATALSVYLWTVHLSVAVIVLALTAAGFGLYLFLLGSAIMFSDSPFQTPLAPFLVEIWKIIKPQLQAGWTLTNPVRRPVHSLFTRVKALLESFWSWLSRFARARTLALPRFIPQAAARINPKPRLVDPYSDHFPQQRYSSPEAPAVLWLVETSTDPMMLDLATEMGLDLTWDHELNLTSPVARLRDRFHECIAYYIDGDDGMALRIRKGMSRHAIQCGKLYCVLRLIARGQKGHREDRPWYFEPCSSVETESEDPVDTSDLLNVVQLVTEFPEGVLDWTKPDRVQWTLRIMPSLTPKLDQSKRVSHFLDQFSTENTPSLDPQGFTAYLCCLNSILHPVNPRVTALSEKSYLKTPLLIQLFQNLQRTTIDSRLVARIITTTTQLASKGFYQNQKDRVGADSNQTLEDLMTETARFCTAFLPVEGQLDVLLSAAILVRLETPRDILNYYFASEIQAQDLEGLYLALEYTQQSRGEDLNTWDSHGILAGESLLQLLLCAAETVPAPPPKTLMVILRALRAPGDMPRIAYSILTRKRWLLNPNLESLMRQYGVWSHLGSIAVRHPTRTSGPEYFKMGANLAQISIWKPCIHQNLAVWMVVFCGMESWQLDDASASDFNSGTRNIWVPDWAEEQGFADKVEENWALGLTALSKFWTESKFTSDASQEFIALTRCTVAASLRRSYFIWDYSIGGYPPTYEKIIPSTFRAVFGFQLSTSLIRAAQVARNAVQASDIPQDTQPLHLIAGLLETLGHKIGTDFESGSGEIHIGGKNIAYGDWEELEKVFQTELDALEKSLRTC